MSKSVDKIVKPEQESVPEREEMFEDLVTLVFIAESDDNIDC